MQNISISQIVTYNKCTYAHHLQYGEGLRRKYEDASPLSRGQLIHEGLAGAMYHYYDLQNDRTPDYIDAYTAAEAAILIYAENNMPANKTIIDLSSGVELIDQEFYDEYNAQIELAIGVTHQALKHLDVLANYTILDTSIFGYTEVEPLVEWSFSHPIITDETVFNGRIDVIWRNKNTGQIEVVDWKTRDSFKDHDYELMNMQVGAYQWVVNENLPMDEEAYTGVIYQIKPRVPEKPSLNKPTKKNPVAMSRNKNITTDWPTYRAALIEVGLDPADYQDMKEALQERKFFDPIRIYRDKKLCEHIAQVVAQHADAINLRMYAAPVYGYPCQTCTYKQWCTSELTGLPTKELIGETYVYATEH